MRSKLQMSICAVVVAAVVELAGVTVGADMARADERCDSMMAASIHDARFLVDSIRVDKPGLARVYAADGSEFTAGQALWMKGQMREIERACANGDQAGAAQRLAAIQALVTAHSR
jgi:drug/metabolite transporter superfamily protein YnfA